MPTQGQKAKLKQILKDSQSVVNKLERLDAMRENIGRLENIKLYNKAGTPIGEIDSSTAQPVIFNIKQLIQSYLDDQIDALFADAETTRKEANP